ncbi:MAG: nitric oxide reductase activation protein NorD [bacterium]
MSDPPTARLSYSQIESRLEQCLDAVLSSRRTAEEPARALASLPRAQQEFALHWTDIIAKSNSEMAYQFVGRAPRALALLGAAGARLWLLRAMDVYDKEGLYPGSAAFARVEEFAREHRRRDIAVSLDEVRAVLARFIRGLSGRDLKIEAGERARTDTETLYLPARINRFDARERNYLLYKATAVHLWAQSRFGTFRRAAPDAPHLIESLARFDDGGRALALFNLLETIRLNACIARELPGLAREMLTLDAAAPTHDATWRRFIESLERADADVGDTLKATAALYPLQMPWPAALAYQGELDLEAARATIEQRLAADKVRLQNELNDMLAEQADADADESSDDAHQSDDERFSIEADGADGEYELQLDGEPMKTTPEIERLLSSLLQDLERLPPDWLEPAGDGEYRGDGDAQEADERASEADALRYDEWDFRRQSYRKNWCTLRERSAHPVRDDFIAQTLDKHWCLVAEIRRHFEALRGDERLLKRQGDGDDIDLDALVTACADARAGVEMSDRLFTRKNKVERDLAVVFMVDVSGSTKGWINLATRESLVLLCEALEALGDQYAIYGFSGMTRNRCEIYRIKTFAQRYDDDARARISGLRPQDYTRMGATIRHLIHILRQVEARTRVLITLSDGKPDDYDGYRGEYGIEDTRQALLEARHAGIHPFCITIDTEAGDYLPHMYGHASYALVDEVRKLPLKVADIYRRLTT